MNHSTPEPTPRDRVSQAELRHSLLLIALAWGVFGTLYVNTVMGAPFAAFARKLGATTLLYGIMCSLPSLGALAQIPGAYIVERIRRRKALFLYSLLIGRASWLVAAALPWLFGETGRRVAGLMSVVFVASVLTNLGSPGWLSWFGDVVPQRIRGAYIGVRARLATLMGMVAAVAAGWALDFNSHYWMYALVFGLAAVTGLADPLLLFGVREPRMTVAEHAPRLVTIALGPLRDRTFRRYLAYAASAAVCYGIFGPFAWLYALEYLRLGKLGANLYLMVLPMLAMTAVFPLWGRTVDRYGCRPTLAVAWMGLLVFPAAWFFATPGHTWWLAGVGLVVGGFLAGAQVAEFDLMFSMTPVAQRSVYVASVAVVSGLFAAGAPAMGGALAQALKGVHVPLWGMTITNLHVLLLISLALRIAHILYFVPRLPETRAEPAMRLALDLLRAPFGALAARLTWPDWAPRRKPPE